MLKHIYGRKMIETKTKMNMSQTMQTLQKTKFALKNTFQEIEKSLQ